MERKINGISYDLATNLVHYEEENLFTLKRYSLMLLSATIFKRPRFIESIYLWIEEKKNPLFSGDIDISMLRWNSIELNVEMELMMCLQTKLFKLTLSHSFINESNHFISMQIYDFITKGFISKNDIEPFLQNLHFTNQGTINLRNTVLRILKVPSTSINTLAKFKLACNYFMKEEIMTLFEDLSRTHSQREITDDSLFVQFWMHAINNNFSNFPYEIPSDTLIKLIQTAVENNNEVAVQFLWSTFVKKESEKKMALEKIIHITAESSERINICMYLLFQLNKSDYERNFKKYTINIIVNVIKNIRWHNLLLNIFNILKSDIDNLYLDKLGNILMQSYCRVYPVGINFDSIVHCYICLLECGENRPPLIIQYLHINFEKILLNALYKKDDMVILSKFYGRAEMEIFLSSKHGFNFMKDAIQFGELKTVEEILLSLYPQNDSEGNAQINELNVSLEPFRFTKYKNLLKHYIFRCGWENTNTIKIIEMFLGFYIKRIIFNLRTNSIDELFCKADEVLTNNFTCFLDIGFKRNFILDADKIDQNIEKIRIPFYNEVLDCVLKSKWEFLEKLFDWKGCTFEEKKALRRRLLNDNSLIPIMPMMDEMLEFLYSFDQFLEHDLPIEYSVDRELKTFKKYVFSVSKFHKLLTKGKIDTIKNYLKWFKPSWEEAQKYKWRAELIVGNDNEIVSWLESFQSNLLSRSDDDQSIDLDMNQN